MKDYKITISLKSIIFVIIAIVLMLLSWELRGLMLAVFFAYIINAGLRPIVDWLVSIKISRGVAIFLTYLFGFVVIGLLGFVIISRAVIEVSAFFNGIDVKVSNLVIFVRDNFPFLKPYLDLNQIQSDALSFFQNLPNINWGATGQQAFQFLSSIGTRGLSLVFSVFGGILTLFVIVMLSAYMLRQEDHVYKPILNLLPSKTEKRLNPVFDKIESSLGSWMLGQLALMFMIGFATYIILIIPGFFVQGYSLGEYALVIAIIAGLLEGIPSIGPLITLVVALFMAVLSGAGVPILIYIAIAFILLQQLEGVVIVPAVMKRAVDLHPILSIIGAIAGLQLGGPIGALLSIPIVATLQIVVLEVSKQARKEPKVEK